MQQIKASVWPHGHSGGPSGPVDVAIGVRVQPPLLRTWDTKVKPWFQIEQPDPESNLSLIRVAFCTTAVPVGWNHDLGARRANVCRKNTIKREVEDELGNRTEIDPGGVIVVAIKGRYTTRLEHPLPLGKYEGTCEEGNGWVLFVLQARTLIRQSVTQKRNILQPGDFDYQETLNGVTSLPNKIIV
jgi:hypothetical protein